MTEDNNYYGSSSPFRTIADYEETEVRAVCDKIGYGRVMRLASELWKEKLAKSGGSGGEFVIGACAALTVVCQCMATSVRVNCDWCEGTGWVTKHVGNVQKKTSNSRVLSNHQRECILSDHSNVITTLAHGVISSHYMYVGNAYNQFSGDNTVKIDPKQLWEISTKVISTTHAYLVNRYIIPNTSGLVSALGLSAVVIRTMRELLGEEWTENTPPSDRWLEDS